MQKKPPPPFITSSLQQEVSNKFRISPKATMISAQKLYEGGLITYMRTDSVMISDVFLESILSYIDNSEANIFLCSYIHQCRNITNVGNVKSKNTSTHESAARCQNRYVCINYRYEK